MIQPQQPGVGAVQIYPQQPGVGLPAALLGVDPASKAIVNYSEKGYGAGGATYAGFPRTTVAAGATVNINVSVRRPFLPQLLGMPSTVFGLELVDALVQGVGLFANDSSGGVPNEMVSEVSNFPQIQWPTLDTNIPLTFVVRNPTGAPLVFSGTFWGTNLIPA